MAIYPPIKKIFNWQLWNEKTVNYLPLNGDGPPASTPNFIGQIYIDTTAGTVFVSVSLTGTPLDWAKLN